MTSQTLRGGWEEDAGFKVWMKVHSYVVLTRDAVVWSLNGLKAPEQRLLMAVRWEVMLWD